MKKLGLTFFLLTILITAIALARPVHEGIGSPVWSKVQACNNSNATIVLDEEGGDPFLINAAIASGGNSSALFMEAEDALSLCFVMDVNTSNCDITTSDNSVDDGVDSGQGLCYSFVQAGDKWIAKPNAAFAKWANGIRGAANAGCATTGWCSGRVTQSGETVFPPCEDDDDCQTDWGLSGATCRTAADIPRNDLRHVSLGAVCRATGGSSVDIHLTKELSAGI